MVERIGSSSNEPIHQRLRAIIRTLQIIVLSLAVGALTFLVVVVFVIEPPPAGAGGQMIAPTLTHVSLAFAVLAIAARLFIPNAIIAAGRRRIADKPTSSGTARPSMAVEPIADIEQLYNLYQTRTIVGAAMIEGTTFFLLIAFLIERQPLALAVAAAFIAGIFAHMPTESRVESWIEGQLQRLENDRQLHQLAGEHRLRD
jgi:hypothetical protein